MVAAAVVGPEGSVIAFEPVPRNSDMLLRNVSLNGFQNVRVMKCALADVEGSSTFFVSDGAAGTSSFVLSEGSEMTVDTTTLDAALGKDPVKLVKVDVEGAEVAVLRGATNLLAGGAIWIIEIEPVHLARQGATAEELLRMLKASGRVCRPLSPPNYLFFRP
jgi:FkbM family methyltransferase